jgi:hypothetical protein
VRTRNELIKALTESFRRDFRGGHSARAIAEKVADQLVELDNEHQRMVATLQAEYEASIAALRRELRSAEQDFEDGLKALQTKYTKYTKDNVVPMRPS